MSITALSPKLRSLIQRAVKDQGTRAMTILSKESGEEFKKLVGTYLFGGQSLYWSTEIFRVSHGFFFCDSRTTQLA